MFIASSSHLCRSIARRLVRRFARDESGAVSADWVVLTAILAGMGIAVTQILLAPMQPGADNIGTFISSQTIQTTFN